MIYMQKTSFHDLYYNNPIKKIKFGDVEISDWLIPAKTKILFLIQIFFSREKGGSI